MENGVIFMEGMVASEDGEESLSGFILVLERGIFKNVKLVKTKDTETGDGSVFEIKCRPE